MRRGMSIEHLYILGCTVVKGKQLYAMRQFKLNFLFFTIDQHKKKKVHRDRIGQQIQYNRIKGRLWDKQNKHLGDSMLFKWKLSSIAIKYCFPSLGLSSATWITIIQTVHESKNKHFSLGEFWIFSTISDT